MVRASVAAAALAAAALAAVGFAGSAVGARSASLRVATWPEPSVEGWVARFLSIRKAMADLRWLDILQYAGDSRYYEDGGKGLVALANRTADLDPHFIRPYAFAGSMLYWQCDRPVEAVELVRRGILANPREGKLELYLAAFTYGKLDKLKGRVGYLAELADDPDSSPIVRRILAHTLARNGDYARAAAVVRAVLAATGDPAERRWAEDALRRYSSRMAKPRK
jgi:hypothetical protein